MGSHDALQKVRQKNQEMKVLMDQMRNLLWDVNAMLTLRKWRRATNREGEAMLPLSEDRDGKSRLFCTPHWLLLPIVWRKNVFAKEKKNLDCKCWHGHGAVGVILVVFFCVAMTPNTGGSLQVKPRRLKYSCLQTSLQHWESLGSSGSQVSCAELCVFIDERPKVDVVSVWPFSCLISVAVHTKLKLFPLKQTFLCPFKKH